MSADPCQDFDKFACGGWRSRNPIPKSQSQWTQFKKLWQHEETLLRDVIERQANSSGIDSMVISDIHVVLYYSFLYYIYNNYCTVYSKVYSLMIFTYYYTAYTCNLIIAIFLLSSSIYPSFTVLNLYFIFYSLSCIWSLISIVYTHLSSIIYHLSSIIYHL